jgi:hypothetical protein
MLVKSCFHTEALKEELRVNFFVDLECAWLDPSVSKNLPKNLPGHWNSPLLFPNFLEKLFSVVSTIITSEILFFVFL